jgi:nicotinamidase-related amidase
MLTGPRHESLLEPTRGAILVIDVQEGFRSHVPDLARIAAQIRLLLAGAELLDVPIAASEQYPQGLGHTIDEVGLPPGTPICEKVEFAMPSAPGWDRLPAEVRDAQQLVLVGIETHVCVRHTALALLSAGRRVQVVVDAVASHTDPHRDVALRGLEQAGARLTTVEQVLFDWLRTAGTPAFRQVQALLKAHEA